ncbi:MAG: riboflavin synthase [Chthoniobacterales bacterium]
MFTGLIEEVGTVLAMEKNPHGAKLAISAAGLIGKLQLGESIAVNGCCLTVAACRENELVFDLLEETVQRTNLKTLRRDDRVNLERALAADGRRGGHFVQGHVDCEGRILNLAEAGADWRLAVEFPTEFAKYVVEKGSVAVNGISLTIAEVSQKSFAVWIIPHTKAQTNLATARPGDMVNLEFDLIAKYVERMVVRPA